MNTSRHWLCCAVAVLLTASTGCRDESAAREDAGPRGVVIAEEHLDHMLPAHKPHDFPDAAAEIRKRDRILREELQEGDDDHFTEELRELLDILNWLPEMAADSEIRKPEWESVRAETDKLAAIYRPLLNDSAARKSFLGDTGQQQQIESVLDAFDALVEKYPQGFEPVFGHRLGDEHDHDHHHHHH